MSQSFWHQELTQPERQLIEEDEIGTPETKRFSIKGLSEGFSVVENGLVKFQAEAMKDSVRSTEL